ncbi:membrane dipeptidase (peptidase family M19) [Archangium gephyra]|uniref:Membrane dipeptidase (Peptidase family M19) n=1 Tax=Archangium gephyra TaxID=48 RepID=A0AAC8TIU0_9BACT|nr:membrane dipeptidase [Archangium gephyra]AKJ05971.1 peptidase, M19 family [Archangium gephyra]REG27274.1 membrane dipeptidase (peptidase family M19) [Archangium gephyra]
MASPVFGFADLHCHLMAHLGFGGHLLAGRPDGDIEQALARCDLHLHGKWGIGNFGKDWPLVQAFIEGGLGHGPCGHGTYADWPTFNTLIHQQLFVDWLRRAHDGGLRLLCSVAVNNELLAEECRHPDKDESSIEKQMRELRRFVERHADWMGLALSASQARQLITAGKLAVVAGVEVDSLDSLLGDREALNKQPLSLEQLPRILRWLRDLGFRMMTPLHLANNSFGGAAVYDDKFNLLNHFLRGRFFDVQGASDVGFRLGQDMETQTKAAVMLYELTRRAHYPKGYALNAPGQGHVNQLGLTPTGHAFLREAMRQGFILDVEHMSERCTNDVLSLAEQSRYPVVASHCAFREQGLEPQETSRKAKRASEYMKTRGQARRILELGGLLGPITNQHELKDFPGGTVDNDCARSSKTWAQSYQYALSLLREVGSGGVAMGTDFNGLNQQPGPRYGPNAAAGLKDDPLREKRRPVQQRLQRNKPPLPYSGTLYRTDVPFVKSRAGSREFDFNTDGLAHVGLLPDFIRDLLHVGMTDAQMDPLFSSAEAFLRMWESCEGRGAALVAGELVDAAIPRLTSPTG